MNHRRLTEAEKWFRSVHESGHAVICEHLRFPIVCVSIADCLDKAGFTLSILPENMTSYQNQMRALGGLAAELLVFGTRPDGTAETIATSDLKKLGLSGVPGYEVRESPVFQLTNCRAGDWVQSEVETFLLRNGQVIALVKNASAPYDLVWDRGEERLRIQVKKGRVRDGVILFVVNPRSRNARGLHAKSYIGKIDAFVVFVPELNKFYLVPIEVAPHGATHMELASRRASHYEMRFATDTRMAA